MKALQLGIFTPFTIAAAFPDGPQFAFPAELVVVELLQEVQIMNGRLAQLIQESSTNNVAAAESYPTDDICASCYPKDQPGIRWNLQALRRVSDPVPQDNLVLTLVDAALGAMVLEEMRTEFESGGFGVDVPNLTVERLANFGRQSEGVLLGSMLSMDSWLSGFNRLSSPMTTLIPGLQDIINNVRLMANSAQNATSRTADPIESTLRHIIPSTSTSTSSTTASTSTTTTTTTTTRSTTARSTSTASTTSSSLTPLMLSSIQSDVCICPDTSNSIALGGRVVDVTELDLLRNLRPLSRLNLNSFPVNPFALPVMSALRARLNSAASRALQTGSNTTAPTDMNSLMKWILAKNQQNLEFWRDIVLGSGTFSDLTGLTGLDAEGTASGPIQRGIESSLDMMEDVADSLANLPAVSTTAALASRANQLGIEVLNDLFQNAPVLKTLTERAFLIPTD